MVVLQGTPKIWSSISTVAPAHSFTLMYTLRIAVVQLTELNPHMMLSALT